MAHLSWREPTRNVACHATPRQVVTLAATAQDRPPEIAHCSAKGAQRRAIHRHPVITEVAQQDRTQVRSLFPHGRVHALPQFLFQGLQLGLPPLAHRLSQHREASLPGFSATMRKPQEVERLRFAVPTLPSIVLRETAELDDSCFVGMQFQPELRKTLPQFRQKPLGLVTMLKSGNKVIGEADEDDLPVRLLLSPSLDPEVE